MIILFTIILQTFHILFFWHSTLHNCSDVNNVTYLDYVWTKENNNFDKSKVIQSTLNQQTQTKNKHTQKEKGVTNDKKDVYTMRKLYILE